MGPSLFSILLVSGQVQLFFFIELILHIITILLKYLLCFHTIALPFFVRVHCTVMMVHVCDPACQVLNFFQYCVNPQVKIRVLVPQYQEV
jgi:hypothetical protein